VLRVLIRVKANPDWQSLHNFDKVATCIFRWQQAEQRARGSGKVLNRSFVISTERIHVDSHRFSRTHVLELRFFEIRRHPDVLKRNNGEQALAGLNPLAELDRFAANNSADRSIDFRIAEIEGGAAKKG
jgi:hypothetical protein